MQPPALIPAPDPGDPRPLVVALPYAGGGAAPWRNLASALAPTARFAAVQLPGRENRLSEAPYRSMEALLDAVVPQLRPYTGRLVLFGHSMGATIALGITRRLAADGALPTALVVSAAGSPERRDPTDRVHLLDDERFMQRVLAYGGVPSALLAHPELLALLRPALRADFTVLETWQPPEPLRLDLPITVLSGEEDRTVTEYQLTGWQDHSARPVRRLRFPGGHFFVTGVAAHRRLPMLLSGMAQLAGDVPRSAEVPAPVPMASPCEETTCAQSPSTSSARWTT